MLPRIPENVNNAIGANWKPIIIKKNIFVKNLNHHPDLSAEESRKILNEALYSTNLYGQTQPKTRPNYWVAIRTSTPNRVVVLEVTEKKDNVEIVGWRYAGERQLEELRKQAEREDGQLLILTSDNEAAAGLSTLPSDVSTSKDTQISPTDQTNPQQSATEQGKNSYSLPLQPANDPALTPEQKKLLSPENLLRKRELVLYEIGNAPEVIPLRSVAKGEERFTSYGRLNEQGRKEGLHVDFDRKGNLANYGLYHDGRREGMHYTFTPHGERLVEGEYHNGTPVGTHRTFYDYYSHTPTAPKAYNLPEVQDIKHEQVRDEITYNQQGRPDGESRSYSPEGKLLERHIFNNGKLLAEWYDPEYLQFLAENDERIHDRMSSAQARRQLRAYRRNGSTPWIPLGQPGEGQPYKPAEQTGKERPATAESQKPLHQWDPIQAVRENKERRQAAQLTIPFPEEDTTTAPAATRKGRQMPPSMLTDAELLERTRTEEGSTDDWNFFNDEYDRRHRQEYADLTDHYRNVLEQTNPTLDDAYDMLATADQHFHYGGYASTERTELLAQRHTLQDYIDQKEAEQAEAEMGTERYSTSKDLHDRFGERWLTEQTNDDGRHSTQIAGTINSYKKFSEWVEKDSQGKGNVSILDASSGLGHGTEWMRQNGMEVDDVEPYPSADRQAPTYKSYDDIDKQYDYIISNAVLNVIPEDWRADLLHNMAGKLKQGGKLVINVRSANSIRSQGIEGKTKITLDDPSEVLVLRPNGSIRAYQKGFTKDELREWCEKELGDGYDVQIANNKNAGATYETAVVITNNGSAANSNASGLGQPIQTDAPVANVDAKIAEKNERSKRLDDLCSIIDEKGKLGPHQLLHEINMALNTKISVEEGKTRSTQKSEYHELGNGITLRITDHQGNAGTFAKRNNYTDNYGIVIKISKSRFKDNPDVDYIEYVYFPDKLTDASRQKEIIKGLRAFVEMGDFSVLPQPDKVNTSGKFKVRQPQQGTERYSLPGGTNTTPATGPTRGIDLSGWDPLASVRQHVTDSRQARADADQAWTDHRQRREQAIANHTAVKNDPSLTPGQKNRLQNDMIRRVADVRALVSRVREGDRESVKAVTQTVLDLADAVGDGLTRGAVKRLMHAVENATTKRDVKTEVDKAVDVILTQVTREAQRQTEKLLHTKARSQNRFCQILKRFCQISFRRKSL